VSRSLTEALRLYAVTDRHWLKPGETLEAAVEAAIAGGVTMVQLREKALGELDLLALALRLRRVTERYGVPLIVNDFPRVARDSGAAGVHVGADDCSVADARRIVGPEAIVGVSVVDAASAVRAQAEGADYLGVGAVFSTATKGDADTVSLAALAEICAATPLPVVAIGGISASNVSLLSGTGIAGVAVVSAIFADVGSARVSAQRLVEALDRIGLGSFGIEPIREKRRPVESGVVASFVGGVIR